MCKSVDSNVLFEAGGTVREEKDVLLSVKFCVRYLLVCAWPRPTSFVRLLEQLETATLPVHSTKPRGASASIITPLPNTAPHQPPSNLTRLKVPSTVWGSINNTSSRTRQVNHHSLASTPSQLARWPPHFLARRPPWSTTRV